MTCFYIDGIAFGLPIFPLTVNRQSTRPCFDIAIINDITAHGDRSALLGVQSKDPQFLVTEDTTNITFLDEQGIAVPT